jgi:hypothetical protein
VFVGGVLVLFTLFPTNTNNINKTRTPLQT